MKQDVRELQLGEKIRALRTGRGLTVGELASRTGLPEPVLSELEEGVTPPTIGALLKMAGELGVGLGHFFKDEDSGREIEVVRAGERRPIRSGEVVGPVPLSYSYASLSHTSAGKSMQPFFIEVDIDIEDEIPLASHQGEEFIYVLDGEMEMRFDDETVVLRAGDSLYFNAQRPHALYGRGPVRPRAVAVVSSEKPMERPTE